MSIESSLRNVISYHNPGNVDGEKRTENKCSKASEKKETKIQT